MQETIVHNIVIISLIYIGKQNECRLFKLILDSLIVFGITNRNYKARLSSPSDCFMSLNKVKERNNEILPIE